jgi:hypothetical protein
MYKRMAWCEGHVARDDAADLRSESGSIGGVLSSAAVRVDDVEIARGVCGYCESGGAGALGESAVRRTDDDLLVAAGAQSLCERPERLLPSAPGAFGVDMGDGQRAQKTEGST